MSISKKQIKESEFPTSRSEGAFKTVEIYDTFVYKQAKTFSNEYGESNGYSKHFCEHCQEYHYNHHDNDDDEANPEECESEIAVELAMLKKYKRLPIFPPLLWEDEDGFAMARVTTYNEIEDIDSINSKEFKRILKKLNIDLIKKLKRNRIQTNVFSMGQLRIEYIVKIGIKMKMPYQRLLNNLYMLILVDFRTNVLRDAHSGNIGFYKGNVVMFDLGQCEERCRQDVIRYMKPDISWQKKRKLKNNRQNIFASME